MKTIGWLLALLAALAIGLLGVTLGSPEDEELGELVGATQDSATASASEPASVQLPQLPVPPGGSSRPIATADSGQVRAAPYPRPQIGPEPSAPARGTTRLLIPVAGAGPDDLVDTYTAARSNGRSHDAIDIAAPRGTPVIAVAPGTVMKLFDSEQGGITLYQLAPDRRTVYYYAHLNAYAAGIEEGMRLTPGDTIGYVGDTGNAGAGNFHLHFEVGTTEDPEQYWGTEPENPYPLMVPERR